MHVVCYQENIINGMQELSIKMHSKLFKYTKSLKSQLCFRDEKASATSIHFKRHYHLEHGNVHFKGCLII